MGILQTADTMVDNSMKQLSDVLNSKFTTYLQGNGTPVLVTYYNIDANSSTSELGSGTYDQMLGKNSPLRYNKIVDFPVYGLKDFIPSKDQLDGGLIDMDLDIEVVILPNSIKPSQLDYFTYHFLDGKLITYKVTDIEFSSIKSNNFYKLSLDLMDINDTFTTERLEAQTIKTYKTCLDVMGTNERCIIEDTTFQTIDEIEKICSFMIQTYMDTFYDNRYNALIYRNNEAIGYPLFDPYLTKFIIDNNVLDDKKRYVVLVGYDLRYDVSRMYNKSIYKNLELRDTTHINRLSIKPVSFRTFDTNPFAYYGEEVVFSIDLVKPTEPHKYSLPETTDVELVRPITSRGDRFIYDYLNNELLNRISNAQPYDDNDITSETSLQFGNVIIHYLTQGSLHGLLTNTDLNKIMSYEISYNYDDFIYVPMLIYILQNYVRYLRNNTDT